MDFGAFVLIAETQDKIRDLRELNQKEFLISILMTLDNSTQVESFLPEIKQMMAH